MYIIYKERVTEYRIQNELFFLAPYESWHLKKSSNLEVTLEGDL